MWLHDVDTISQNYISSCVHALEEDKSKIAVMGGEQAAKVLLQIEKASLKAKGKEIDKKTEKTLLKNITAKYNAQTSPYYAASRLWIDAIIDPLETRKVISNGIEAANHAPIKEVYNPGIIQS